MTEVERRRIEKRKREREAQRLREEPGTVRLDSKVTVASHAAAQPPSRVGLRPGQKIELRYLPDLSFRFDQSFAEAERVETLLRLPEVARDLDQSRD